MFLVLQIQSFSASLFIDGMFRKEFLNILYDGVRFVLHTLPQFVFCFHFPNSAVYTLKSP